MNKCTAFWFVISKFQYFSSLLSEDLNQRKINGFVFFSKSIIAEIFSNPQKKKTKPILNLKNEHSN